MPGCEGFSAGFRGGKFVRVGGLLELEDIVCAYRALTMETSKEFRPHHEHICKSNTGLITLTAPIWMWSTCISGFENVNHGFYKSCASHTPIQGASQNRERLSRPFVSISVENKGSILGLKDYLDTISTAN